MPEPDEYASLRSGDLIRESRTSQGTTMSALAAQVGCSSATVWRWENEHTAPQRRFHKALADALSVEPRTLDQWLNGVPGKDPDNVLYMPATPGGGPEAHTTDPNPDSTSKRTGFDDLQQSFLAAVIEGGIRQGHASNPGWERTASTTARALGLPWHTDSP